MAALLDSLKAWQAKHDLTQEQAAARIGVTLSCYNKWLRGVTEPSPMARARIERVLAAGDNNK